MLFVILHSIPFSSPFLLMNLPIHTHILAVNLDLLAHVLMKSWCIWSQWDIQAQNDWIFVHGNCWFLVHKILCSIKAKKKKKRKKNPFHPHISYTRYMNTQQRHFIKFISVYLSSGQYTSFSIVDNKGYDSKCDFMCVYRAHVCK